MFKIKFFKQNVDYFTCTRSFIAAVYIIPYKMRSKMF